MTNNDTRITREDISTLRTELLKQHQQEFVDWLHRRHDIYTWEDLEDITEEAINDCYEPIKLLDQYPVDHGRLVRQFDPIMFNEAVNNTLQMYQQIEDAHPVAALYCHEDMDQDLFFLRFLNAGILSQDIALDYDHPIFTPLDEAISHLYDSSPQ